MSVATKEQILKVLKAYNPWWGTGVVNPGFTKTYRRFAYYEAMKRLEQKDLRRTIVLTGTRQNDRPPQVLLLQPLHRLIVSKPTICLGKARVYHACAPPGIIRL